MTLGKVLLAAAIITPMIATAAERQPESVRLDPVLGVEVIVLSEAESYSFFQPKNESDVERLATLDRELERGLTDESGT